MTRYRRSGMALAAELRRLAAQIQDVGELPETALIVDIQVTSTSGASPDDRAWAVEVLADALGLETHTRELSTGSWHHGTTVAAWPSVYTAVPAPAGAQPEVTR